jgi:hypothetical protein
VTVWLYWRSCQAQATTVAVVDVGGDALAHPGDPGLRSPLADITSVVAAHAAGLEANLFVLAPGADGELPVAVAMSHLSSRGAQLAARIPAEVAALTLPTLEWHPSEATAILVASALGRGGIVETRDRGLPAHLGEDVATAWRLPIADALPSSRIARAIADSRSLDSLRSIFVEAYDVDEIGYEEDKAARLAQQTDDFSSISPTRVDQALADANGRGVSWLTRRRLQEVLQPCSIQSDALIGLLGSRWIPPLVSTASVDPGTENQQD